VVDKGVTILKVEGGWIYTIESEGGDVNYRVKNHNSVFVPDPNIYESYDSIVMRSTRGATGAL
jgi:hypothetical protein